MDSDATSGSTTPGPGGKMRGPDPIRRPAAALDRFFFGEPALSRGEFLLTATALGMLAGLFEAGALWLEFAICGDPRLAPHPDAVWLAPVGVAALALVAATAVLIVVWPWRSRFALGPVLFAGTMLAIYSALIGPRIRVHSLALLVLAAGAGTSVASAGMQRPTAFRRVFRWVSFGGAVLVLALASVGVVARVRDARGAAGLAAAPAPEGARNLIVLILDTVRSKSLGLYGHMRPTTPQLERYASQGIVFDYAFSTAPWTLPSHASLFTGEWPHALSADFGRPLDDRPRTLAEVLRDNGYATGGFVANLTFATRYSGIDRGFDTYVDYPLNVDALALSSRWTRMVGRTVRRLMGRPARFSNKTAATVNAEFLRWLDTVDGRPFFAFLNYFDAHEPYETQPGFDTLFRREPPRFWLYSNSRLDYTPQELQEFIDAYESCIAYADHQLGMLLDELDRRGLLRNTVVIVASDHGEQFGEHGLLGHSNSLYLPLLHVPLVVLNAPDAPAGARIPQPVSLRDLPATAIELIGLADRAEFPGSSLSRYWKADTTLAPGSMILAELTKNESTGAVGPVREGDMKSIVEGRYHYILGGGGEELYDYIADPDETVNLIAEPSLQPLVSALRTRLEQLRPVSYSRNR